MTTDAAPARDLSAPRAIPARRIRWADAIFHGGLLVMIGITLSVLAWLLITIIEGAVGELDWAFLSGPVSIFAETAGFSYAIKGSLILMFWAIVAAIPTGFAAALYLEKFAPTTQAELRSWLFRVERRHAERTAAGGGGALGRAWVGFARFWARIGPTVNRVLEVNISNLAAVPSIIYGLLGLGVFIAFLGLGKALLAGGLVLGLLVMPVVIISAREAIRAVPISMEQGAMGLGATKFQAVTRITLPSALPGMLTGTILALSRAIGETAPLLVVGGALFATNAPSLNPLDANDQPLLAMPLQIYSWAAAPQRDLQALAPAGILTLLVVLLIMNSIAIFFRNRYSRRW